jgi:hypothetical protein
MFLGKWPPVRERETELVVDALALIWYGMSFLGW